MLRAFVNCGMSKHFAGGVRRGAILALASLTFASSTVVCAQGTDEKPTLTWVDESGSHKIEAKFVKLDGPNVVLLTALGKQINVPYSKLNLSSQLQAKKLDNPQAFEPPKLPSSFAAPPLPENPYPEDPTIDEFLEIFQTSLKEGRAEGLWYALPPDMQNEIELIVVKAADIAGPKFFKQLQSVLPNVLSIVRDKRSFILSHPRLVRMPEVVKPLSVLLPAIEPVLEVLTKPARWSSENFKGGKVGPWIVDFSNDLIASEKQVVAALSQLQVFKASMKGFDIESLTYKVLEKTADTAKVEINVAKQPKQVINYKKIGRTWLPVETADNGLASLVEARNYLERMDKAAIDQLRLNLSSGLTMANGVLGSLANAKTQMEFNQLIDPFIGGMEPMMRQALGPTGRPGMPGSPGMSGSGSYGSSSDSSGSGSLQSGSSSGSGSMPTGS